MCARSKFLQNLRMKVRLAKISAGREKFLYFRVSKIWPKHSFGTVSSENRLRVSQTQKFLLEAISAVSQKFGRRTNNLLYGICNDVKN